MYKTSIYFFTFSHCENILKFLERNRDNKRLIISESRGQLIRSYRVELYNSATQTTLLDVLIRKLVYNEEILAAIYLYSCEFFISDASLTRLSIDRGLSNFHRYRISYSPYKKLPNLQKFFVEVYLSQTTYGGARSQMLQRITDLQVLL